MASKYYIDQSGSRTWEKDGQTHREDGPAIIWDDGSEFWYRDGYLHREDGPAVSYSSGGKLWYNDGNNCGDFKEWCRITNKTPEDILILKIKYGC